MERLNLLSITVVDKSSEAGHALLGKRKGVSILPVRWKVK